MGRASRRPRRPEPPSRAAAPLLGLLTALALGGGGAAMALPRRTATPTTTHRSGAPADRQDVALEPPHLRIALSRAGDQWLKARRVRRLLRIELTDVAEVDAGAAGPLEPDLIRVWIDVPRADRALIEVRHGHRSLARRVLAIGGYTGDAAARVVVIATANMVRVQVRAAQRRAQQPAGGAGQGRPPPPQPSYGWTGAAAALWSPAAGPALLAGPELALSHRSGWSSQRLYGRWLVGEGEAQQVRWLEVGAALGGAVRLAPRWRLRLGAMAGAVALGLPRARWIDQAPATGSDWTARAAAAVGIERRLTPNASLVLDVEPGASLRALTLTDPSGRQSELGGLSLGLRLGITATEAPAARARAKQAVRPRQPGAGMARPRHPRWPLGSADASARRPQGL